MKHFTLWIWPDNRNPELEEKIREALRNRGFEWDERVEECMSAPITVECQSMEFGIDESNSAEDFINWLGGFTLSDSNELLFHGMTMDKIDDKILERHGLTSEDVMSQVRYNEEKAEDVFIEECNDPYDK
jgi:hypothetical protein